MTSNEIFYLASASPRRRELLNSVGVSHKVFVTDIDESRADGELPENYVRRLAEQKACTAYESLGKANQPIKAILAADTIVVKGLDVFCKPNNLNHAMDMWRALSNSEHKVMTAVALLTEGELNVVCSTTTVRFSAISETQMQAYWLSNEPQDKAGGYAIQGLASAWVESIEGSYSGVVGLPLAEVNQLLSKVELNWL